MDDHQDQPGIKFGVTHLGTKKLIDSQGYSYTRRKITRAANGKVTSEYWTCVGKGTSSGNRTCSGAFTHFMGSGEWKVAKAHSCELDSLNIAKAGRRLKELTLAAEDGTRPIDIVNKMLGEVPPETWKLLPHKSALIMRVRRYARAGGVVLAPNISGRDEKEFGVVSATSSNHSAATGAGPSTGEGGGDGLGSGGKVVKKKKKLGSGVIRRRTPRLKLVDEEGRDLNATIDMIVTAGEDKPKVVLNQDGLQPRADSASASTEDDREGITAPDDSNDFVDDGGLGDDDDLANERTEFKPSTMKSPNETKAKTVSTSSKVKAASKRPVKKAVKSGEKCFVCGDDILVSEASSSSQETFRKACCYLNVKSENEWFPRKSNGQFYSFCELCTNEITRIQELYRNVEEKQSLIFKKVQQLEKLIANGEILDNWLAEAPASSAKRFEGFRKQVLINYKNKLKLRREMRMGTKLGQDFMEIQPITSAHMFASDPAETDAFRKVFSTTEESKNSTPPVKRGRGRPKKSSKKNAEEEHEAVEKKPEPIYENMNEDDDDGGDFHPFDDASDNDAAASVASEKERKFWEDDPTKLNLPSNDNTNSDDNDSGEDDKSMDGDGADDQSDSDYDVDNDDDDDDEDWGTSKSGTSKRASTSTTTTSTGRKRGRPPTKSSTTTSQSKQASSKKTPKPNKPKPPKSEKPKRKFHRANIQYPDVVLTKEGRMVLSDIEIIKNPPDLHNTQKSFTCGACGKITLNFTSIKEHICGNHLQMYKCEICAKTVCNARSLWMHKLLKHSNAPRTLTPCKICGKPLSGGEKIMRHHIWYHLSEEEKKDPKYQNYTPFHKRDPNRPKQYRGVALQCKHCPSTFYRMDSLRAHELAHTGGGPEEIFQCQFCGRLYKTKSSLYNHNVNSKTCGKALTEPQKPESFLRYPCPVCLVPLKSPKLRKIHMGKFHGSGATSSTQPFGCPKCPRRFTTRKGFQSHKRICVENSSKTGSGRNDHRHHGQYHQDTDDDDDGSGSYSQFSTNETETGGVTNTPFNSMSLAQASTPTDTIPIPSSSEVMAPLAFGYNMFGSYGVVHPLLHQSQP